MRMLRNKKALSTVVTTTETINDDLSFVADADLLDGEEITIGSDGGFIMEQASTDVILPSGYTMNGVHCQRSVLQGKQRRSVKLDAKSPFFPFPPVFIMQP